MAKIILFILLAIEFAASDVQWLVNNKLLKYERGKNIIWTKELFNRNILSLVPTYYLPISYKDTIVNKLNCAHFIQLGLVCKDSLILYVKGPGFTIVEYNTNNRQDSVLYTDSNMISLSVNTYKNNKVILRITKLVMDKTLFVINTRFYYDNGLINIKNIDQNGLLIENIIIQKLYY